ncbi:thioesterase family protein [uncultured Photobacterium sp.]|uniref:acyl-CoA thioesterase n=1 Tax=uncultured Photobacterium sp. TaxID=173973 RepID=UPI0026364788|nr:acyl-CoA thioesterase [uncultured Photobacterium sp.]
MKELLKDYPVITEIPVAWGEMDAFQHVNNVVYFRYFETARIEYFREVALMEEMYKTGIGPVLSETSCCFKLPVTYPDTLYIGSRVSELHDDRFTMEYAVVSKKLGAVATFGKADVVMYDFNNKQKAKLSSLLVDSIQGIESQVAIQQETL